MDKPLAELKKLTEQTLGGLPVRKTLDRRADFLNMLLYGSPGVGKTTFIATAAQIPAMCPIIVLDVEGGDLSLSGTPNVEVVRITKYAQMQPVYDELYRMKHPYRTVAIDNLTELRYFSMGDIMLQVMAEDDKGNRDPDIPSQREWGKNQEQIRRVVRGFRDLPMHTIFTAHDKEEENKSGLTVTKPSLPGKLANEVSGFVDLVLYYYMKVIGANSKRFILTSKTAKEDAKDRSGKLPQVIEEPNMTKLIELILPHLLKENVNAN